MFKTQNVVDVIRECPLIVTTGASTSDKVSFVKNANKDLLLRSFILIRLLVLSIACFSLVQKYAHMKWQLPLVASYHRPHYLF